ncbi:MAG: hypothetical protein AAGA96_16495 [Verrucomicrobiota bacterium]
MKFMDSFFLACPMCMSGADGQLLLAANSAILLLLFVLCGVLMAFLGFIFYIARRAKRFQMETELTADAGETVQK